MRYNERMSLTFHISREVTLRSLLSDDLQNASVLDGRRQPVGYVDVAQLMERLQAGKADPVRHISFPILSPIRY